MALHLRPAGPDDAPQIAAVHTASWAETYSGLMPEAFLASMTGDAARERRTQVWGRVTADPDQITLVALWNGELVGYVNGGAARDHPGYEGELNAIYLLGQAHGRGVGSALFHSLTRELKRRGFRSMALWVLDKNPAREFYRRMGGQEDGEKVVPVAGGELREIRLGWPDLSVLEERPAF